MGYLFVPTRNAAGSLVDATLYSAAKPGDRLSGLASGTAYQVYALTLGPVVIPDAQHDPSRVAPTMTSPGGRANVIPASFYEEGADEMLSPTAHPHIMGITHRVVKSGRWSDPETWDTGTVPGDGAVVSLGAGMETLYDVESDVILKDLLGPFGSIFRLDPTRDTRMRLDYAMFMGTVDLTDPTESQTPGKPKHEFIFHASQAPGATARLGFMPMGPARIRGARKAGHLRVADADSAGVPGARAGQETLTLPGLAASGWRVGDVLHVLGTEYLPPAVSDPHYAGPTRYFASGNGQQTLNEYQFGQDEERRITAIDGDRLTLDSPLAHDHQGMTGTLKDGTVITVAPVVANLSRSIRFRSASADEDGHLDPGADITDLQKRAHIMFMRCPDVDVRYFETKNMARTSTDPSLQVDGLPIVCARAGGSVTVHPITDVQGGTPLANPMNVRGRYAIHFHWCGGPYAGAPQINCIGATSWAPIGAVPIPGWAITQHGTRMAIEDCVISNVRGAGMVSELGNEIGQWAHNVVTGCRSDGDRNRWGSRQEYYANHNGSTGVAYENQSRAIVMHGNIAGSSKYAFLWHAQKDNAQKRSQRDVDLRLVDGMHHGVNFNREFSQDEAYGNINAQIPPMHDNEAHACRHGFAVIHRQGDGRHADKTPMLMERFHCLNVPYAWEVPEYSNSYYMRDCLFQGPAAMAGGFNTFAFTFGSVTWDWTVANCHLRNYLHALRDTGAGLNYEGHFIDVTTENCASFSSRTDTSYSTVTDIANRPWWNVMGDAVAHPTDPNRGVIRVWRNIDSATLPTPYPLAPYGRKLPANQPDGTPYPAVKPGDAPYFVLGDGINGVASTDPVALNLTLTAGSGRGQGRLYGIIRDSVGDRRYPDWQSSETFPSNLSIKSHRTFGKLQPEQVVQRWGCWLDGATWKTRTWFLGADRFTHVRFAFHVDWTLAGFPEAFLAAHDTGGPCPEPAWPDKLEAVPVAQRPLSPLPRSLRFLSRTRLEVVEGQPLAHRLRYNDVAVRLAIAGGADAAQFRIASQQLQWAANGTRAHATPADADRDNVYEVILRATDTWGNQVETAHQVVVVPAERVSDVIEDTFDRADGPLEANPAYLMRRGAPGSFVISGNRAGTTVTTSTPAVIDLGSLGTSQQEVMVNFSNFTQAMVVFRMQDADNWLGFHRLDWPVNGLVLRMCVDGKITTLAQYANYGGGQVRITVRDRRFALWHNGTATNEPVARFPMVTSDVAPLELDPLSQPGVVLLPETAPRGTHVGLVSGSTKNVSWIDNLTARALAS